jgi:hypothetical protein
MEHAASTASKEKSINVLEGMTPDASATGKLRMKTRDHRLPYPIFYGMTRKVPEYKDRLVDADTVTIPSGEVLSDLRGNSTS